MNTKEENYAKFYLVQEMMGTVETVRKFDPACASFVAKAAAKSVNSFSPEKAPAA